MAVNGMNQETIEFFKRTYKILTKPTGVGCPEMSKVAFLTQQAANKHARRLQAAGYLDRPNYWRWKLSPDAIKDPDFKALFEIGSHATVRIA